MEFFTNSLSTLETVNPLCRNPYMYRFPSSEYFIVCLSHAEVSDCIYVAVSFGLHLCASKLNLTYK